jgi:cystinosin
MDLLVHSGNPVKFGLGNVTLVFDVIFFLQHYVLYRVPAQDPEEEDLIGEQQQLLH